MEKVLAFLVLAFLVLVFLFLAFLGGGYYRPTLNLLKSPKFLVFFKFLFFGVGS